MPRFLIANELRRSPTDNSRATLINPHSIIYAHEATGYSEQEAIDICLENGDWLTVQGTIAGLEKMIRMIKE